MGLSNSYDYVATRDIVINAALRKVGVLAEGQSPSTTQVNEASSALNFLIKAWQAEGLPLWERKILFVLPMNNINEYRIGPGASTYHAVTSFITTKAAASSIAGVNSLTVDSITGISASDHIGIDCSGTMYWTTVNGSPSGNTVNIAGSLPGSLLAGAAIYVHTPSALAQKPLRVLTAWRSPFDNQTINIPLNPKAFADMYTLINSTENMPIQYAFVPSQNSPLPGGTSSLWLWPRFKGGSYFVTLDTQYPFMDVDSGSDNLDFPVEFTDALIYALAVRLAPEYGMPLEDRMVLKAEAQALKDDAFGFDLEGASIFMQPAPDWSRR